LVDNKFIYSVSGLLFCSHATINSFKRKYKTQKKHLNKNVSKLVYTLGCSVNINLDVRSGTHSCTIAAFHTLTKPASWVTWTVMIGREYVNCPNGPQKYHPNNTANYDNGHQRIVIVPTASGIIVIIILILDRYSNTQGSCIKCLASL